MLQAESPGLVIGLNAVIVAVTDERPRVLVISAEEGASAPVARDALPFGPLDPERDRTLELALRGWVREQTELELGYVEQLYTFADRHRDPGEREGGPRVISIGYLSLVREHAIASGEARVLWRDWYSYLPWEDRREPRGALSDVTAALGRWVERAPGGERARRRERVDIAFGVGGAPWDGYRALDRYELLYEAGLVSEAQRDRAVAADDEGLGSPSSSAVAYGRPMRFDHRRILATAIQRMRGKIKFRPVVFELLPPTFTLLQLQLVVESLAGKRLHKQNFRRLVEKGGMVEGTGQRESGTGGRPAELFRFRREVLRERPTPGIGLPGLPAD